MHFSSIFALALALATSSLTAATSIDLTPVDETGQGIIKTNQGGICLGEDAKQARLDGCGVFVSDGEGALASNQGFLAWNDGGQNLTIQDEKPELVWKGAEIPADVGPAVYGLTLFDPAGDAFATKGPVWTEDGDNINGPREGYTSYHLIFYQSPDGSYY